MARPTPADYEATAQELIAAGVPEDIARDPNDTNGLATWLEEQRNA